MQAVQNPFNGLGCKSYWEKELGGKARTRKKKTAYKGK